MGIDIHITLTLFTVLAPAGALAHALLSLLIIREKTRVEWVRRLEHWLVAPLAVCMLGLVASATHLGAPDNALYVFNGLGRSPLSNEVTSAFIFLAIAGIYWLSSFSERIPFILGKIWLIISCIAALGLIFMISVVYAIPTIPTWNNELIPLGLWVLSCTAGPVVALSTLAFAKKLGVDVPPLPWYSRCLLLVSLSALVASLLVYGFQVAGLENIQNSSSTAAELVPWYSWAIAAYGILGMTSIVLLAKPLLFEKPLPLLSALGAVILLFIGSAFIRVAFYSSHMTI